MIRLTLDPNIAQIGPLVFGWHGVLTALGVFVAFVIGHRRLGRAGVDPYTIEQITIWALVGGVVGARLMHVLDHLPYFVSHPAEIVMIWQGGIAVYGAFLGGIAGGLAVAARARLRLWPLLDAAAPAMLVGQIIGRIGCFINGDAWGKPTNASWGLVYENPNTLLPRALLGVPTHPYPLYEMVADAILLTALLLLQRRLRVPGTLFLVGAIGYGISRFGLTYFRQETILAAGLQEAQIIAIVTGLLSLGLLYWRLSRHRLDESAGDESERHAVPDAASV